MLSWEKSAALEAVTREWMKCLYELLLDTDYPQEFISEHDWEYTWDCFLGVPAFIASTDAEGRTVNIHG